MAGKWYHTDLGTGTSIGLCILLGGLGIGACAYLESRAEVEKIRAKNSQLVQERDLNGNGKPERYIEFNGQKYFSTIDGKDLEESLK